MTGKPTNDPPATRRRTVGEVAVVIAAALLGMGLFAAFVAYVVVYHWFFGFYD
jgi:tellurite resistance protein TehA-like permease